MIKFKMGDKVIFNKSKIIGRVTQVDTSGDIILYQVSSYDDNGDLVLNWVIASEIELFGNPLLEDIAKTALKVANKMRINKNTLLSEDEKVILRNVDREIYKWIARDKIGNLNIFERKPIKEDLIYVFGFWDDNGGCSEELNAFEHLFQFIKWEDEEPYNIEELLKGDDY